MHIIFWRKNRPFSKKIIFLRLLAFTTKTRFHFNVHDRSNYVHLIPCTESKTHNTQFCKLWNKSEYNLLFTKYKYEQRPRLIKTGLTLDCNQYMDTLDTFFSIPLHLSFFPIATSGNTLNTYLVPWESRWWSFLET